MKRATAKQKSQMAAWYRKNRAHKLQYQKARQAKDTSRHRARRSLPKSRVRGKDVHHVNGNPHDNRKKNLQVVRRHHSKIRGRVRK